MSFRTIIEPFRIKSVEAVKFTRREEREARLVEAGHNVFLLHAEDVLIDLLTDSGTSAMSAAQWGALMQGDESYAGSRSFHRFHDVVSRLTGLRHIIPTHQGRAAERILFHTILEPGMVVPSNNHFDTTRANIEAEGAEALDLVIPQGRVPSAIHPFKGNVDLGAVEALLRDRADQVPVVMVTVTNNSGGGQSAASSPSTTTGGPSRAATCSSVPGPTPHRGHRGGGRQDHPGRLVGCRLRRDRRRERQLRSSPSLSRARPGAPGSFRGHAHTASSGPGAGPTR